VTSRAIARFLSSLLLGAAALVATAAARADATAPAGFVPPARLTVVLDDGYAPYSFAPERGQGQGAPMGIVRDLWDLWSRKTGVPVDYRAVPHAERLALLDHGAADVVGFVLPTEQRESRYLLSPAPVAQIEVSIFFGRDIQGIVGSDSLEGFTIGVTEDGICAEWLAAHGVTRLRSYPSWDALFDSAARGEINVFCSGRAAGIRRLYTMNAASLFKISPPLFAKTVSWAVPQGKEALRDFIAAGFARITPEERTAIEKHWSGEALHGWSDTAARLLIWGLALAAGGAMLMLIWNASLRAQVAAKTANLAANERRYRALIEAVPVGIFEADAEGGNVYVNGLLEKIWGMSAQEIAGGGWVAAIHPEDRAEVIAGWHAAVADGRRYHSEHRLLRRDGSEAWVTVEGAPRFDEQGRVVGYIGSIGDMTERRRLEQQSQESTKLEALGQFAGGVAHDFNNFLGAILGYAQFILEDAPDHPAARYAQRILTAGRRGRALVEQILTFTRRSRLKRSRFHLAELLPEIEELMFARGLSDWAAGTAAFRCDNADPDAVVEADRGQLGQLLLNLCINAQDALRGRPGSVAVSIRRTALPAGIAAMLPSPADDKRGGGSPEIKVWTADDGAVWAAAGRYDPAVAHVSLMVRDDGPGMEAELLLQAFTPFFTTKARGQGTGLGLAVVKGIVAAHDGALVVESRPGEGTRIEVALPRLAVSLGHPPLAGAGADQGVASAAALPKGRILLVDDDADFSDMLTMMLSRLGFEVVPYGRAKEALDDFRELPETWDVLITDQNMPEIAGLELVRAVRALRPGFPCLVCSAYSETLTEAALREAGAATLIRKPVDRALLLAALERALDPARNAAQDAV
jgi:PAS domain S-box-containing protein